MLRTERSSSDTRMRLMAELELDRAPETLLRPLVMPALYDARARRAEMDASTARLCICFVRRGRPAELRERRDLLLERELRERRERLLERLRLRLRLRAPKSMPVSNPSMVRGVFSA